VDTADYKWLSQWTWYVVNGYVARQHNRKIICMHREIMKAPPGKMVDHVNHNKLDNSRPNLRVCAYRQNQHNQRK